MFIGNPQGGADFLLGAISFADAVVAFSPGIVASGPTAANQGADNALRLPNDTGGGACSSAATCKFVSLGVGGTITLRFDDNRLTRQRQRQRQRKRRPVDLRGRPGLGGHRRRDQQERLGLARCRKVTGRTRGLDIDAFGWIPADPFAFVRLRDDPDLDDRSGASVGADIDAAGAISTVAAPVPEPATYGA